MLKNIKIGTKIISLTVLILCLMTTVVVFVGVKMQSIGKEIKEIVEEDMPLIEIVTSITEHQLEQAIFFERLLYIAYRTRYEDITQTSAMPEAAREQSSIRETSLNDSFAQEHQTTESEAEAAPPSAPRNEPSSHRTHEGSINEEFHAIEEKVLALGKLIDDELHNGEQLAEEAIKLAVFEAAKQEFTHVAEALLQIEKEHTEYEAHVEEVIALLEEGRLDETITLVEKAEKAEEELVHELEALLNEIELFTKNSALKAEQDEENALNIMIILSIITIVIALILAVVITRGITRPLKTVVKASQQIAMGDLTAALDSTDRRDEVGILTQTFANMINNLRKQTQEMIEGVNVLASATAEISSSVTQLASSSAETSTSVGETTTTLEEVRQTSQLANQKAQQVSGSAQQAAQIAQSGRKATEDTVAGMDRIREQMASIADSIVKLSEQSQAIGGIISTVSDLADQSNLLAVNASIEATKAGEQGKGFTVVAQEIRSLAEQSKQATTQVQTILNNIQKATGAAVMATEQGTRAVEAGMKQANEAGGSIQVLAGSIGEAAQAMSQIAISSQEQTVGMNQIAEAMESIRQASTQNVDSSNQLEMSAQNLQELGHRLKQLVDTYTV